MRLKGPIEARGPACCRRWPREHPDDPRPCRAGGHLPRTSSDLLPWAAVHAPRPAQVRSPSCQSSRWNISTPPGPTNCANHHQPGHPSDFRRTHLPTLRFPWLGHRRTAVASTPPPNPPGTHPLISEKTSPSCTEPVQPAANLKLGSCGGHGIKRRNCIIPRRANPGASTKRLAAGPDPQDPPPPPLHLAGSSNLYQTPPPAGTRPSPGPSFDDQIEQATGQAGPSIPALRPESTHRDTRGPITL